MGNRSSVVLDDAWIVAWKNAQDKPEHFDSCIPQRAEGEQTVVYRPYTGRRDHERGQVQGTHEIAHRFRVVERHQDPACAFDEQEMVGYYFFLYFFRYI